MRFLIDEMFPRASCGRLADLAMTRSTSVTAGLAARPDPEVAALVAAEDRALVTENVKDFAAEEGIVIVCVLKARLPSGGMHVHLAGLLDRWAKANPDPYRGPHRP